jgi:uncharacterized membrane-anchored protein
MCDFLETDNLLGNAMNILELLSALITTSPTTLSLLLGLAAVCVTGFALIVVYRALSRENE